MSFDGDLSSALLRWETELAAGVSNADVRYHHRRLAAERNSSGHATGAFSALQSLGVQPIIMDDAVFATDKTAFETALAVLVADGASPTQGHVTTANSAYTTLKGDLPP